MALSTQKKVTNVGHFRFNSHISVGIPAFLQCQQSINPEFSCPLNCGNYENLRAIRLTACTTSKFVHVCMETYSINTEKIRTCSVKFLRIHICFW